MRYLDGLHKIRSGDASGSVRELLGAEQARVFFTDPPWGPGMMKYFQTLADRDTGRSSPSPVRDYLDLVGDLASQANECTDGPVFIEYGIRWRDEVIRTCESRGLIHLATIQTRYAGGVFDMHIFSPSRQSSIYIRSLVQSPDYQRIAAETRGVTRGVHLVRPFVQLHRPSHMPPSIIVDPCCGLGATFKIAKKVGMRFYGNELNPKRLARTEAV